MYYAIKSWFINVTKYKKRLIELNKKINWVPKHIKEGRFGEWLNNVKDWALSRKKSWGTPLPIWRCECGYEEAIGSIKELKEKSINKISDKEIDLHKPWIDNIKFKCKKCRKEMSRVSEVIDCWYDSGSATFAQFHYPFKNKKEFQRRVPYDFISEAIDQTRGWFYTLHVLSTMLFDKPAYKNVICAGHIVDEKGEKMSKSRGNILSPDLVLDTVGVDATRLQFCIVDVGNFKKFGIETVKKETLPFLNVLWNTCQFYKQLDNKEKSQTRIEDRWILSRLNSTIKESTQALESYQIEKGLIPIIEFVTNDLSKTYIKMIRGREDKNVKNVIGEILDNISKLLAPYAPNISDIIHKEFSKKESVHLSSWPKTDNKRINKKLEDQFKEVLKIIERGLAERDKAQVGLKWPLAEAKIKSAKKISKELQKLIEIQLNIKKAETSDGKETSVKLNLNITPELEAEGYARNISRAAQELRKKIGLIKKDIIQLIILSDQNTIKLIESWQKFIQERTNSKKIFILTELKEKKCFSEEIIKIKGREIKIYIKKI